MNSPYLISLDPDSGLQASIAVMLEISECGEFHNVISTIDISNLVGFLQTWQRPLSSAGKGYVLSWNFSLWMSPIRYTTVVGRNM